MRCTIPKAATTAALLSTASRAGKNAIRAGTVTDPLQHSRFSNSHTWQSARKANRISSSADHDELAISASGNKNLRSSRRQSRPFSDSCLSRNLQPELLTAHSKLGLDPSTNRFHAPIVYHENYSFDNWPKHYTFPMDKFARLAHCLVTNCKASNPHHSTLSRPLVRSYNDFFRPLDLQHVPWEWFQQPTGPIDFRFLKQFLSGQLTKEQCRLIGFREQTSRPELIERTVLEVIGTMLTCQLALQVCFWLCV